jgi:hypothetical protein
VLHSPVPSTFLTINCLTHKSFFRARDRSSEPEAPPVQQFIGESEISALSRVAEPHSALGIHKHAEIRSEKKEKIKEAGAMGYILLWLLGIPIPILLIIFLLRGCT